LSASDVVLGHTGAEAVIDEIRLGTYTADQLKPQWVTMEAANAEMLPIVNTVTSLLPDALPPASLAWLSSAAVSARVADLDMGLSLESPTDSLTVSARVENLAWSPVQRIPGGKIRSVHVDVINGEGSISMPSQSLEILPAQSNDRAPTQVSKALALDDLSWNAQVNLPSKTLTGTLATQHDGAVLTLRHTLQARADGAPHIDAQGEFSAASILSIKPWLTQSWMPVATRTWLSNALQAGQIKNGKVLVFGRMLCGQNLTTLMVR